jgi:hypothetical protein
MMPSYAFLDVKISCERLTRKVLCCADDDVVFCASPMDWIVRGGLIGALTGLRGGVVIVPLLLFGFGVDVRYATGASLVFVLLIRRLMCARNIWYTVNFPIASFRQLVHVLVALCAQFVSAR